MLNKRNSLRNRNKTSSGHRNAVGSQIRKLRQQSKITQEDLAGRVAAQMITLDRTAIYRIETGTRAVTDIELIALAKALKVSIGDLFL